MIRVASQGEPPSQHDDLKARYYGGLRARVAQAAHNGGHVRSVGVTSTDRGEGVSTVAADLALARLEATPDGQSVLLIDASDQGLRLYRSFRRRDDCGSGKVAMPDDDFLELVEPSDSPGLSLARVPPGQQRGADRLRRILSFANERFDFVVVDLPATRPAGRSLDWAPLLDGILLVVQAQRTTIQAAVESKKLLSGLHANLIGVVFNEHVK